MTTQEIKTKVYLQNDKLFNQTILMLYNLKNYITMESKPKDEQEQHLYYMIEKEANELMNSIEILKNKRTESHYKNN